jgi:hypothetical protein
MKFRRLTGDDRERMMRSRALPDDFDIAQTLESPFSDPLSINQQKFLPLAANDSDLSIEKTLQHDIRAKESFEQRCLGCHESWIKLSASSQKPSAGSEEEYMQDLKHELAELRLYKEWAERHRHCLVPSPQSKAFSVHDEGKRQQVDLTAQKPSKDVSAVVHSVEAYGSESDYPADGSSDDHDIDCAESIMAHKEHVLNKLMLCVYEMFTSTGSFTAHGNESTGSSISIEHTNDSSTKASRDGIRKRSRDDKSEHSDQDGEKEESRKRQKLSKGVRSPGCKTVKKLACPYYKRNPYKPLSSGVCCGPGWDSVHRIKYCLILRSESIELSNFASGAIYTECTPCLFIADDVILPSVTKVN